jgi:folate-dependent phosphoribosylglycinamide formyltransferase PurN
MRVVIVTGTKPHHKNLCAVIARAHNVVGIIHPSTMAAKPLVKVQRIIRRAKSYGWGVVGAQALARLPFGGANYRSNGKNESGADFAEGVAVYEEICKPLAHFGCDVRAASSALLLKSLKPDVTICLGGPVYPKTFIEAGALSLNFHSGLSPLYNGAASIEFAFANGHPHLCGGTLMLMGTEVDGGGILGHYLPEIQSGDTPRSLFCKTVRGAAVMYSQLLPHFETNGMHFQYIPQPSPLFYTRGFEFSWHHRAMIGRNVRRDIASQFRRAEQIVEYWRAPSATEAQDAYRFKLDQLLWQPLAANANGV